MRRRLDKSKAARENEAVNKHSAGAHLSAKNAKVFEQDAIFGLQSGLPLVYLACRLHGLRPMLFGCAAGSLPDPALAMRLALLRALLENAAPGQYIELSDKSFLSSCLSFAKAAFASCGAAPEILAEDIACSSASFSGLPALIVHLDLRPRALACARDLCPAPGSPFLYADPEYPEAENACRDMARALEARFEASRIAQCAPGFPAAKSRGQSL